MYRHNSHHANYNRQGRNVRQIQKYIKQTNSFIQKVIKITPKNNSVNNMKPIKEKFVKLNIFQNIKTAGLTFAK
jgi:translation initiation factor 2 alpha subunit (eIF-2alpha)